MLDRKERRLIAAHDGGWLQGYEACVDRFLALAKSDTEMALGEQLWKEIQEAQAEAYADAVETDD